MSVRKVFCPTCGQVAVRQFTVTDAGRIRITEGFRQVTASMVCADYRRTRWTKSKQPPKPRYVGGFGTSQVVTIE